SADCSRLHRRASERGNWCSTEEVLSSIHPSFLLLHFPGLLLLPLLISPSTVLFFDQGRLGWVVEIPLRLIPQQEVLQRLRKM
ncbi:hypothetical protein PDJAM_G00255940, partial [Pangasius djambal]|nr:hypothetical protein [Pangasius djambal]